MIVYARVDGYKSTTCVLCDIEADYQYNLKAMEDKLSDAEYEIDEQKDRADEFENQLHEVEGLLDDLKRAIGG
jgi:septal ring factor EnvC (AmiA/AmiB activator)